MKKCQLYTAMFGGLECYVDAVTSHIVRTGVRY